MTTVIHDGMELSEMFDLGEGPSKEDVETQEDVEEDVPETEEEMEIEEEPEAVPDGVEIDPEERFLRLQAEFDNYRKFMEKAMSDGQKRAGERMACEVLEVLDNLERALTAKGEDDSLREGVQMVYAQMYDVLGRWGVSELEAQGCEFDPYLHEAVERVEDSDEPNGTIVKVYQKGFSLNSNVIRHARVAVAAGEDEEESDETPEEKDAPEGANDSQTDGTDEQDD